MIYNLYKYIKNNLTGLTYAVNGWSIHSPEQCVAIIHRGGIPDHDNIKQIVSVQVMSRALENNDAHVDITSVYNLLKNRFGLVLPEVTVGDTVFPEVKTYQISPIQIPGYIGSDRGNLHMWSFNLTVTII